VSGLYGNPLLEPYAPLTEFIRGPKGDPGTSADDARYIYFDRTYAVPTDQTIDVTAKLQSAVNDAYALGGASIVFSDRQYRHTGINWPGPSGYIVEPITIEFIGPFALQTVPFCPGAGGDSYDTPLPTSGTVFWCTVTAGGSGFWGNLSSATQGLPIFRNCQVLMAGNPQTYGINAGWLTNMITDNVIVGVRNAGNGFCTTGKGTPEIPEPLNLGAIGIIYPGEGNGGTVQARNTVVYGHGVGVTHSEHFIADNLTCFKNKVGLSPRDGWHASTYGRVSLYWNTIDFQPQLNGANQTNPTATKPITRINASQIDSEETDETTAWYTTRLHIDDPYNRLRGRIRWHRMKANVGIFGPLLRRGGVRCDIAPTGGFPRATLDVVAFTQADGSSIPSSLTGAIATEPRGDWFTSGNQIGVNASGVAVADSCVWDFGVSTFSLTTMFKATTSLTELNAGLALFAIDANNMFVAGLAYGVAFIQKIDTSTYSNVGGSVGLAMVAGQEFELTAQVVGRRIQLYVDGVLTQTYVMSSGEWTKFSASTSHGLWIYGGPGYAQVGNRWDHLRLETPGPVAA
jgi:hypothetical protein